jgi:hypothetical protein
VIEADPRRDEKSIPYAHFEHSLLTGKVYQIFRHHPGREEGSAPSKAGSITTLPESTENPQPEFTTNNFGIFPERIRYWTNNLGSY